MAQLDSSFIARGVPAPPIEDPNLIAQEYQRTLALQRQAQLAPLQAQELAGRVQETQLTNERLGQENAVRQRTTRAQQALTDALAQNTKTDDAGKVVVDHEAIQKALTTSGFGPEAVQYSKERRAELDDALKRKGLEVDQAAKVAGRLGSLAQTVVNQPDPASQGNALKNAVATAVSEGVIDQPTAQKALASVGPDGTVSPQGLAQISQWANGALTVAQQNQAANEAIDRTKKVFELAREKTVAKHVDVADKFKALDAANPQDKAAYDDLVKEVAKEDPDYAKTYLQRLPFGKTSLDIIAKRPLKPEELQKSKEAEVTAIEQAKRDTETARHNKEDEKTAALKASIDAKKFTAEYGGDAIKGWAASIKDNPDAVASIPPTLRTGVQREFTKQTGLPFPKALTGAALDQERAARNGLAALAQINDDIKDPEIQSRLGPILGRLGNAEETLGSAVGLSPAAEAKAQRLRTNMRMMTMQEGKSVFGARMPQQLMKDFTKSSPNTKMDVGTLQGALEGMQDAGMRALDSSDQQRFGGKMRSREDRGIVPVKISTTIPTPATQKDFDALPVGTSFKKPNDSQIYVKQ